MPTGIENLVSFSSMPSFSEQKFSVAGKHALELLSENGKILNLTAFFMKGIGKILQISAIRAAEIKKTNRKSNCRG